MSNIFIKDGNGTTIEIFTFEDATSVHHNASVPIASDGTEIFTQVNRGYVDVVSALPAGTNHLGKVSVEGTFAGGSGNSITVSVGGPVSVQATPVGYSDGTNVTRPYANAAGVQRVSVMDGTIAITQGGGLFTQIQGQYSSTLPTLVNGAVSVLQVGTRGSLNVTLAAPDSTGTIGLTNSFADAKANNINRIPTESYPMVYNVSGGNWDRWDGRIYGRVSVHQESNWVLAAGTALIGAVSISPNGLNIPVSVAPPTFNLPVSVHPVTQSGTWTVQPGNTANTTPWLVSVNNFIKVHVCNAAPGAAGGSSITTSVGSAVSVQAVPMAVRDTGGDVRQPLVNPTGNLLVHVCNGLTVDVSVPPISGGTQLVSVGGAASVAAVQIGARDINGDVRIPLTHTDGALLVHVCAGGGTAAGGGGPTVSVGGAVSAQGVPIVGEDTAGNVRRIKTAIDGTLKTSSYLTIPSYTFTRPTDVVAYALGDLVANSTVAGTVVPLSWPVARMSGTTNTLSIRRARMVKSGLNITNCAFRLHIFTTAAGVSVSTGDNRVFTSVWSPSSKYAGAIDIIIDRPGKDGSFGEGMPITGNELNMQLLSGATSISGLLEARGAYTPLSGETIRVDLEIYQD